MSDAPTVDLPQLRERNEQMVLNLIRDEGPISRAELARRSRLSRSTISTIIAALLSSHDVYEIGIGESQGGRRPIMLDFNYQSSYVVGIDVATSSLTLLLTDLQAQVIQRASVPFRLSSGPDTCIPQIADQFRALVQAAQIDPARIGGVGIGIPGPIHTETGSTIAPPVMPGWGGVPLLRRLEQALGRRVLLENDANLGALAEQTWGAARGLADVAYIYFGSEGIGGGIILGGALYRGHIGSAGEIGHLTIDEDGPPCRCGSRGCLEASVGTPALLARAQAQGIAASSIGQLVGLAQAGSPQAQALLAQAGEQLGVAIASLLNLLNPSGVVLGGQLAQAGELVLGPLRATLARRGLAVASQQVELKPAALGPDVIAIGAAALAIRHLFRTPNAAGGPRHAPDGERVGQPASA